MLQRVMRLTWPLARSGAAPLVLPAASDFTRVAFPAARLLLTSLQPALEAAIAREARAAAAGAVPLGLGLFAAPLPAPPTRLLRMLSLRAEVRTALSQTRSQ